MKTSDFYFELPKAAIAQTPLAARDQSKLMVLNRAEHSMTHAAFSDIVDYLQPGDCLVLNNTSVLPARLYGERTSGAKVEFLLLNEVEPDTWHCLVKPGRKARVGDCFTFGDRLRAEVIAVVDDGLRVVSFQYDGNFYDHLDALGEMPLPPYIDIDLHDQTRYQTVYHDVMGSAAAPTAGLHFTQSLLQAIERKGVVLAHVTLHVGLGTFRPVKVERVDDHQMHAEWYQLTAENAARINRAKSTGGRVIAVGTTAVRTLESIASERQHIEAASGWTRIFITPGYQFKVIDALITNFHLPESTLLMLVSAFYQREAVLRAYQYAVDHDYRFFSFGDAMFIE